MKADLLRRLLEDRAAGRPAVLVTDLATGTQRLLHPSGRAGDAGDDGDAGDAGDPLLDAARRALDEERSGVAEGPDGEAFLRVYAPPPRMVLVGGVHIAQALAPMAAAAGWTVTVVDPRAAFASESRFPGVERVVGWPGAVLPPLLDARSALVSLSHDPKVDDPALVAALAAPTLYVGALGSRRTHAKRLDRLREAGLGEGELGRIHAPVGLDIGARTPAEIAVSILAQVVARRRQGTPGGA